MFNGKAAEHLVSQLALPQRCPMFHYGINEPLHHLFTRMLDVASSMPPQADVIHTGLILQLAATIQSRIQLIREQGDRDESFVQQAKQRMTEAPEKPFEMRSLARELGVSYSHFRRVFKISTGIPPQQYLLNLRIIRAKQLMESPGEKLSDVARRAGFSDAYYFSRIFKQRTGIAPSKWRR